MNTTQAKKKRKKDVDAVKENIRRGQNEIDIEFLEGDAKVSFREEWLELWAQGGKIIDGRGNSVIMAKKG